MCGTSSESTSSLHGMPVERKIVCAETRNQASFYRSFPGVPPAIRRGRACSGLPALPLFGKIDPRFVCCRNRYPAEVLAALWADRFQFLQVLHQRFLECIQRTMVILLRPPVPIFGGKILVQHLIFEGIAVPRENLVSHQS